MKKFRRQPLLSGVPGKGLGGAVINFKNKPVVLLRRQPGISNDKSIALCAEAEKFRQKRNDRGRMRIKRRLAATDTFAAKYVVWHWLCAPLASFILSTNLFITMIYRFSTLALSAFLSFISFNTSAQGYGVEVDSAAAAPNQIVCLPVYAKGFTDISSFQYSITWDASVLEFDHMQDYSIPNFSADDHNLTAPNRLLIAWADQTGLGQTIPDGTVVYQTCFKAISVLGTGSDVTPGGEGFPAGAGGAEAHNDNFQDVWTPGLIVPGRIEILLQEAVSGTSSALQNGTNTFQLSPNPTHASSQVLFSSKTNGKATISVTDAQGKRVFDEKVVIKTGENRFDIPASALTAKGMYQVSLQTEKGASSQMLSVN